ncbi:helix-turn-helix domain-containing protein [Nocardia crassostreae]|uniref:helix-turn-helix domain-containing protein n=1 Tax=Nocardia crassostreae TaxID=53428 RepID=UPI000A5BB190|nr:helix-turn-helix domain-containing protein [Nocardia crassostreae]
MVDRPEVGIYLRRRREALGLTQEEVATAASATLSSLRKWEAGLRNPSVEALEAWCRVLDLPDWLLRKVTSLVLNGLDPLRTPASPSAVDADDLDHLAIVPSPAYFVSFPHLDVLAANPAARRLIPSLIPVQPDSPRPANLVEWIMSEPARELLVNWETVATRLIFLLRTMGPGLVPPERLNEIFNVCYAQAPKQFTRFFCTDLSKAESNADLMLIRHSATGAIEQHTYRFQRSVQPIRPYEQLQIVTRRRALR